MRVVDNSTKSGQRSFTQAAEMPGVPLYSKNEMISVHDGEPKRKYKVLDVRRKMRNQNGVTRIDTSDRELLEKA